MKYVICTIGETGAGFATIMQLDNYRVRPILEG